jgi:hypothetical protein
MSKYMILSYGEDEQALTLTDNDVERAFLAQRLDEVQAEFGALE